MRTQETIAPHGGPLANLLVAPEKRLAFEERARTLPRVILNARGVSDLLLLGIGAFSPLDGFLRQSDYRAVVREGRLSNGLPWTIPITLPVAEEAARQIHGKDELALYDQAGDLLGTLHVEDRFPFDKEEEAQRVYGTTDPKHPGVAYLERCGEVLFGGAVQLLKRPVLDPVYEKHFLDPSATRSLFRQKGWKTVVAFQTRNPIHRAHEYIQRCALETVDGLLIHPLVGETKSDDIPAPVRMRCYLALIDNYLPPSRVLLSVFPGAMRYAGPREAVFHALVRKNFGCTHIIIGRDHAGAGGFYGPYDAQRIFDQYDPDELGIQPVCFDSTFYCRRCGQMASEKTCRHDGDARVTFSGTTVRELLSQGRTLPSEFTRPEIAEILLQASREEARRLHAARREKLPAGAAV